MTLIAVDSLVTKLTRVSEASQILLIWNFDTDLGSVFLKKKKKMKLLDNSSRSLSAHSGDYSQRSWLQFGLCPLPSAQIRVRRTFVDFVANLWHAEHLLFSFCVTHSFSKYYLMPFIRICCWDCGGDFHPLSFQILICASSFLTFYVMEVWFHAALLFHSWKALHWHKGSYITFNTILNCILLIIVHAAFIEHILFVTPTFKMS